MPDDDHNRHPAFFFWTLAFQAFAGPARTLDDSASSLLPNRRSRGFHEFRKHRPVRAGVALPVDSGSSPETIFLESKFARREIVARELRQRHAVTSAKANCVFTGDCNL